MNILGTWKKITTTECSGKYPGKIEFKANGIYYAEAAPGADFHPVWDVGRFQLKEQSISMSTSNDAVIDYQIHLKHKTLSFKDNDGCVVEFVHT